MSARAFYAVARGRATGVFGSWTEAERLVSGFAGAKFKKFKTQSEAEAFARNPGTSQTTATRKVSTKVRKAYAPQHGTVAVYTDGGCRGNTNVDVNRDQPAGWGFIAVKDGRVLAERWGPIIIDATQPHYLGAEKASNNTGELSGMAEALLWLRDEEGSDRPASICYDSKYAANITSGRFMVYRGPAAEVQINIGARQGPLGRRPERPRRRARAAGRGRRSLRARCECAAAGVHAARFNY